MKIYTKTGDAGDTGLFGGARVSKADPRVDAYGDVDELNSAIGVAAAEVCDDLVTELKRIQGELFCVGAELASNPDKPLQGRLPTIDAAAIERLETCIDRLESGLKPLTTFILPGGGRGAAALHMARTVARRAERKVVQLASTASVRDDVLRYLNRLSDLIFVMARFQNHTAGIDDVVWYARASTKS